MSRKRRIEGSYVETRAIASHDADGDVQQLFSDVDRGINIHAGESNHRAFNLKRALRKMLLTDLLSGRSIGSIANEHYNNSLVDAVRDFKAVMRLCSAGTAASGLRADELERALVIWRERNELDTVIGHCGRHGPCEVFMVTAGQRVSLFDLAGGLRCEQCPCYLPVDLAPKGARKRGPKPRYCSPACRQAGYRCRQGATTMRGRGMEVEVVRSPLIIDPEP